MIEKLATSPRFFFFFFFPFLFFFFLNDSCETILRARAGAGSQEHPKK